MKDENAKLIAPQQPQAEKTDNELIAEFMGFYITSERIGVDGKPDRVWKSNDNPYFGGFRIPHLNQFESQWDWLMPVVEKIEQLIPVKFSITTGYVEVSPLGPYNQKIFTNCSHEGSRIKACHKAVVEFIKWYNTQTKQL